MLSYPAPPGFPPGRVRSMASQEGSPQTRVPISRDTRSGTTNEARCFKQTHSIDLDTATYKIRLVNLCKTAYLDLRSPYLEGGKVHGECATDRMGDGTRRGAQRIGRVRASGNRARIRTPRVRAPGNRARIRTPRRRAA